MQRILSKRVLRDIRENLLRYLALFFLVALVMYMVVAIVGAAETIMQGTKESGRVHHREDGQFGVFVPLTEKETAQITEKGVTLQRDFSLDFHLGQSTFRVYQARESVDLFVPAEGEEIPAQGEILLEQHYAEKHELQLGDIFIVGGKEFTVTGIGSTPDYDAAFEKTSDTTVDSNLFGFGFVTAEDYEALKAGGQNFRTEDYTYTYLLNDTMTDQELKELLQSFELDRSKVTDTYFLEMLADAEETKNDIQDGIQELLDGVDELVDGVDELADLEDFREGIIDYTDAVDEIADGSRELRDGVQELQDEANDMIDEYFTFDIDNLTQFLVAGDNPRIDAASGDVIINKYAGMVSGIILMVMFTYVISVFVVHNIEKESSVIGALYALGVTRGQLLFHYLLNPMMISFLGGAVGCVLGFSKYGTGWQMQDSIVYFSLPPMEIVTPAYLLVYSLVMPPVTAALVNCLVISKKLKRTALSLLRNEQTAGRAGKIQDVNLGNMKFLHRFQVRQLLREMRSAVAVVIGMFICLLVLLISADCYVLCKNFGDACLDETTYAYMYTYKYPTEDVPEDGTPAYVESLKKEAYGYNLDVTVLGIDKDNPYFPVETSNKKNEIVISSAAAQKFGVKVGDKLVLSDEVNERDYAFTVKDIVHFASGVYVFLDRDAMQELFDQEDDYYNVVFADHALDIDNGRLYSTVSRENVEESSQIFTDMMGPMVSMLAAISALIFMIVMYLMMKVMIDRSAFSISLMKVFGYRKGEIRRLYLDGNFYIIMLGALLGVPLAKWSMDLIFPYFISNVAIGMDLQFPPQLYGMIYGGILICYLVINFLLVGRLNKLVPAEVLKNRE